MNHVQITDLWHFSSSKRSKHKGPAKPHRQCGVQMKNSYKFVTNSPKTNQVYTKMI